MPSKKTPAKIPNRSDFIRAQPATLTPADIVAKGKAQGLKFGRSLVYMVRGAATAKKGVAKKAITTTSAAPKTEAAKPTVTPAKTKSKADFVRAYSSLSPKEVVEKGKAEGVKFDARYVYRVRAMDKTARKAKRAASKMSTTTAVNGVASSDTPAVRPSSSAENLLRAVAAELGLGRAVEILQGERARVRGLMGE
jgi:hypothetical protein